MRRRIVAVLTATLWLAEQGVAAAHGVGVRGDLPLPLWVVTYGAVGVLVVSFLLLVRWWPQARWPQAPAGVALGRLPRWPLAVTRTAGLVGLALVVAAGLTGPATTAENLAPFALYVAVWVGGQFASAAVGPIWRAVDPMAAVAALLRRWGDPPRWLARIGVWPAVVGLLGFTWLELVHPDPGDPRVVGTAIAVAVGVLLLGALWWGPSWIRAADPFAALFHILAQAAPLTVDSARRLRLRPPVVGLVDLRPEPGTTALILSLLGTTTFDGLSRTDLWATLLGGRVGWATVPWGTLGLLATVAAVAAAYRWAIVQAARLTGEPAAELWDRFAHSLVPIAVAYSVAHYFSLLVFEGQRLLALLSDPLGRGWDLLGTAGWTVDFTAVSTTTIAAVQVGAVVLGHVAGVVLAHDRAVALFPAEVATRSQHAMLAVMVGYTVGALLLLLGA